MALLTEGDILIGIDSINMALLTEGDTLMESIL